MEIVSDVHVPLMLALTPYAEDPNPILAPFSQHRPTWQKGGHGFSNAPFPVSDWKEGSISSLLLRCVVGWWVAILASSEKGHKAVGSFPSMKTLLCTAISEALGPSPPPFSKATDRNLLLRVNVSRVCLPERVFLPLKRMFLIIQQKRNKNYLVF